MMEEKKVPIKGGFRGSNFDELNALIDSSHNVDLALLDQFLKDGQITSEQYISLSRKISAKEAHIQEGLINASKNLDTKVSSLEEEVRELGVDKVTGLLKHEALDRKFTELMRLLNPKDSEKREHPLRGVVVVAVDLDDLKKWNEINHSTGDRALKVVATALLGSIREGDYVFRRGDMSDEIVALLKLDKELSVETLEEVLRPIYQNLNTGSIELGEVRHPVTAALGYTVVKLGDKRTLKEILDEANQQQLAEKKPDVKSARIEKARSGIVV